MNGNDSLSSAAPLAEEASRSKLREGLATSWRLGRDEEMERKLARIRVNAHICAEKVIIHHHTHALLQVCGNVIYTVDLCSVGREILFAKE